MDQFLRNFEGSKLSFFIKKECSSINALWICNINNFEELYKIRLEHCVWLSPRKLILESSVSSRIWIHSLPLGISRERCGRCTDFKMNDKKFDPSQHKLELENEMHVLLPIYWITMSTSHQIFAFESFFNSYHSHGARKFFIFVFTFGAFELKFLSDSFSIHLKHLHLLLYSM